MTSHWQKTYDYNVSYTGSGQPYDVCENGLVPVGASVDWAGRAASQIVDGLSARHVIKRALRDASIDHEIRCRIIEAIAKTIRDAAP